MEPNSTSVQNVTEKTSQPVGEWVFDPVRAWNHVWNVDKTLRPWELLDPTTRKHWCLYVESGAFADAVKKAEDHAG